MKKIIFLLVFLITATANISFAKINPDTIRVRLNTPRDAMMTHWKYLKPKSYFPATAAKALYFKDKKKKNKVELAIKLKKIITGRAIIISFSSVPNNPDYIDSTDGRYIYYPFLNYPDIYLERINKKWYYSEETVNLIPKLYDEIYPFTLNSITDKFPAFLRFKILLQMELWQLVGILLIILLIVILQKLMRSIVRIVLNIIFKNLDKSSVLNKHFRLVVRTISIILALIIGSLFLPVLDLPIGVHVFLVLIYKITLMIFIIILSFRITDYIYYKTRKFLEQHNKTMTLNVLPFFRTLFKTILVIIGGLLIIVSLGYDIWPWLAGLSIGGLAIALAAQETIRNIFGSITILADRPFDVGDWIVYDKYEGTVEEIGIRSTTIRTFSDSLLTVPNGRLMDVTIDNMDLRRYRRFQTYLSIVYGTPVEMLEAYVQGIEKLVQKHDFIRKDVYYVYINNLADSSIQIFIRLWFNSKTWAEELKHRHILIKDILELARTLGVEFAFPTQSIFVEHFPGTSGKKNLPKLSQEEIDRKIDEFFKNKNTEK